MRRSLLQLEEIRSRSEPYRHENAVFALLLRNQMAFTSNYSPSDVFPKRKLPLSEKIGEEVMLVTSSGKRHG